MSTFTIGKVSSRAYTGAQSTALCLRPTLGHSFASPVQNVSLLREKASLDLPGERESRLEKVQTAKRLAKIIKDEIQGGNFLYWAQSQKKIGVRNFLKALLHAARKLELSSGDVFSDKEVVVLTAYNCLRTRMDPQFVQEGKKEEGFLDEFPYGLFDQDIDQKVKILAKHYLIDLRGLQTPQDIENTDNYKSLFLEGNLKIVLESFRLVDLLRLLFPQYLDEENPLIRERCLKYPGKWNNEAGLLLIVRSLREILRYDLRAIRDDNSYDIARLENTNWGEVFNDERYGLKNALSHCPYVRTPLEALKAACPDLIGFEEGELKPWKVRFNNMWQIEDPDGTRLIDKVTEYLLERKLECIDESGAVSMSKVREITNWDEEFNNVASGCLQRSGLKAAEAIKRKYPHLFGYDEAQIKPWEIRFKGMWNGNEGKKLFRLAFAYSLWNSGLGNFDMSSNLPVYTVRVSEFENWYVNEIESKGVDLRVVLTKSGLSGALKTVAGDSLKEAVRILFGVEDEASVPKSRSVKVTFCELLRAEESKTERLPTVKYLCNEGFTLSYFLARQNDPMPWDLAKLRIYYSMQELNSTHPLREEAIANIFDPRKYLEDDNALNFTRLAYDMLLYSLRNGVTVDEVFRYFAVSVVDLDEDKDDLSRLYPCEIFNLACSLNRLEVPDIDLEGEDTLNDFQEFNYVDAIVMIARTFDLSSDEKGKEFLLDFVWQDTDIERYINQAFKKLRSDSTVFELRAA